MTTKSSEPVPGAKAGAAARGRWRAAGLRTWLRRPGGSARGVLATALLAVLVIWVLWQRCGLQGCPSVGRLNAYEPGRATVLLDRAGHVFADLAPVHHAEVRIDSLPAYVPAAFVAVEDKRFYRHHAVDWRRVLGAAWADLRAGAFEQGFSTITMQLARNVWHDRLPGAQRTLGRKLLEIRVAGAIERRYTKKQILELYLNQIYFGEGAYGIAVAAAHYFGRPASRLTLAQAGLLAALPRSPILYDPRHHPGRARRRRNLVLRLMAAQGKVSRAAAAAAEREPLGVLAHPPSERRPRPGIAPYFVAAVQRELEDRLGEAIYTAPLRVQTTLDSAIQRRAEGALAWQLGRIERGELGRYDGPVGRTPSDTLEGAVVVMDRGSGAVRALVGGRGRDAANPNWATIPHPGGSVLAPFVFAAALEAGTSPDARIPGAPGTTVRQALVHSLVGPRVRLAEATGYGKIAALARRAGIGTRIPPGPALAEGNAALTPLELTGAFCAFDGQGQAVVPRLIESVMDADGTVLWRTAPEKRRVLRPGISAAMAELLRVGVRAERGTGAREGGSVGSVIGQAGATAAGTGAWFVGLTPVDAATVWIGFDGPGRIVPDATGARLAAPVWKRTVR